MKPLSRRLDEIERQMPDPLAPLPVVLTPFQDLWGRLHCVSMMLDDKELDTVIETFDRVGVSEAGWSILRPDEHRWFQELALRWHPRWVAQVGDAVAARKHAEAVTQLVLWERLQTADNAHAS